MRNDKSGILCLSQKKFDRHRQLHKKIIRYGKDIISSKEFQSQRNYIQHGSIHVRRHCIDVARQSLIISDFLHMRVNEEEMIRGALLHDYFLYDWHVQRKEPGAPLHGYSHPKTALLNATRDYELSEREKDIISKHMWPLTLSRIPRYKESWIVSLADKYCSTLETLKIRKGNIKGISE